MHGILLKTVGLTKKGVELVRRAKLTRAGGDKEEHPDASKN